MVEEGRLARWSRLKKKSVATKVDEEKAAMPEVALVDDSALPVETSAETETETEELAPEDLPDPDTLDKESDFSVFLGDKVPEAIKRRAMSVLWRSDPILANLDGLNDYDEDYQLLDSLTEVVKTAYQAGKGYVDDEEEGEEEADEMAEGDGEEPPVTDERIETADLAEGGAEEEAAEVLGKHTPDADPHSA